MKEGICMKNIKKVTEGKFIFGVCTGLAAHFDKPLWLFRLLFILGVAFGSAGFWIYLALFFLMGDAE